MRQSVFSICTWAIGLFLASGCAGTGAPDGSAGDFWRPAEPFRFFARNVGGEKFPLPDLPAFNDLCPTYTLMPEKTAAGDWRYPFEKMVYEKHPDGSNRPFLVNVYARIPVRPNVFLFGTFDPSNRTEYLAWKARHPEFLGLMSGEWVNDAWQPMLSGRNLVHNRRPAFRITEEQLASVRARDEYAHCCDSRDQFVNWLLRKTFDRIVENNFGARDDLILGEGSQCPDHIAADWGVGELWVETSRNYKFWQTQMMFTRGAAVQYRKPFNWYLASYFLGYNSDGTRCRRDGTQEADAPHLGTSQSAMKRASYLTYLAGAASYQRESNEYVYCHRKGEKAGQIGPEGVIYTNFWNFCKTQPRGVPYRSVALVVPRDRGYTRARGPAFFAGKFPYTRSDNMLDAMMHVILNLPANDSLKMQKAGTERVMANSPYGDVFDVLVPGGTRPETFRRALNEYKVLFVCGEFSFDAETARALERFKARGGVVVDLDSFLPKAWDEKIAEKALAVTRAPTTGSFPELEAAVRQRVLPTHPFAVTGDVQFGFNRLSDGWLVYLINNGGVTKFGDKVESLDPVGTPVTVDLKGRSSVTARELLTGRDLPVSQGRLSLTVPSGDIRIVKIASGDR